MDNNYDPFGNIISTPEMENIVNTSRAEIVEPVTRVTDVSQLRSPLAEQLMGKHLNRKGLSGLDSSEARNLLYDFALRVGRAESSGNPTAKNKPLKGKQASTATGLYQFLVGTGGGQSALQTAVKRAKKRIDAPWLDQVYKSGKVEDLTADQQTVLFLGDILEKSGSDDLVKMLVDPNSSEVDRDRARIMMYLKLHHTAVPGKQLDEAIVKNAKREILGIPD
jgi:hypothetical protein